MPARSIITACLLCLLLAAPSGAPVAGADPVRSDDSALIDEILRASGVEGPGIAPARQRVQDAIDGLVRRVGQGRPGYHRARRLHRQLHRDHLQDYVPDTDGLLEILDSGKFNCLSATLFLALSARAAGYDPVVLESPGHLFLGLTFRGRQIYIETTSPNGFDMQRRLERTRVVPAAYPPEMRVPGSLGSLRYSGSRWRPRSFTLEETVGFVWLNAAQRALDRGEALRAAACAGEARWHLPQDVARSESVHRLLAKAFRMEYETGRFDEAFWIAAIDTDLFPSSTTSGDRILAAAYKRIEVACETGDPGAGETILDELEQLEVSGRDLRRLERRTCPLIAVAAVREGDWQRAERAAARYALAEPDETEGARLLEWVEDRSRAEFDARNESAYEQPITAGRVALEDEECSRCTLP